MIAWTLDFGWFRLWGAGIAGCFGLLTLHWPERCSFDVLVQLFGEQMFLWEIDSVIGKFQGLRVVSRDSEWFCKLGGSL